MNIFCTLTLTTITRRASERTEVRCLLVRLSIARVMMMMMMMFRTVLFSSSPFFPLLHNKPRKNEDKHFFEGRQDVLADGTVRIEQRHSHVLFLVCARSRQHGVCNTAACAYFQGSRRDEARWKRRETNNSTSMRENVLFNREANESSRVLFFLSSSTAGGGKKRPW